MTATLTFGSHFGEMLTQASVAVGLLFLISLLVVRAIISNFEQWKFLINGRRMISDAAKAAGDKPFSLPIFGFGGRMHIVSTEQHWNDLKNADVGHLSLHQWAKEFIQPRYSFQDDWKGRRDGAVISVIRAVRTMSNQLPSLKPKMVEIFRSALDSRIDSCPKSEGYSRLPLASTVDYIMVRVNTLIILGEDAANDVQLIERGIGYVNEAAMLGEVLRFTPKFIAPIVACLIKRRNGNRKYVLDTMARLVNKRREVQVATVKDSLPEPTTALETFVDFCPTDWSTGEILHHFNILWTSSNLSLRLVATQFVQDLYAQKPHHTTLLRDFRTQSSDPTTKSASLLESFLMESMRTNCFQSTAAHRTALRPFTFTDGYTIPSGESVQFYQEAVHFSPERYQNPDTFAPWRYVGSKRSVTDVGLEWPFWGVGKFACPGRFQYNVIAKALAECLLMEYEGELEGSVRKNLVWGENNVPDPRAVLLLRRGGVSLDE